MTRSAGRRGLVVVTAGVYVVGLALVLLSPSARVQTVVVSRTSDVLSLVLPAVVVSPPRTEMLLNAMMVVPLTLCATLVWSRLRWQDLTAYAFIASWVVELVQGFLLAGRSASLTDVAANTAGALAGAVVGVTWRRATRRLPHDVGSSVADR